ncbi:unnamed protein product, partial [Discosporangium mesarthrocarpum]
DCHIHADRKLGVDVTVNVMGLSAEEAARRVVEALGGVRPDSCVDCCGFESSVGTAMEAVRSGGRVCLVGM